MIPGAADAFYRLNVVMEQQLHVIKSGLALL